jgi:uncharacterized protein YcbK (DUF882 family)
MTDYFPEYPWPCKCGCNKDNHHPELVQRLNDARQIARIPFVITSACRCEKKNAEVGGKPDSAHLAGYAADIACQRSSDRFIMVQALMIAGFRRIECGPKHIHVDIDPTKVADVLWLA